ncbi:transglycosylase SLT domain-containing protein [Priestia aryabhattai]|uniref:Transglycosylase SLT domain-containing protein n=1 Tax=Priestia aryabhattai TaxID=412384 RepID=A0ABD7X460_PRIAR|nr:transglycosylase SLT domain-containing protein [Priestia aryabhattai]WEA47290.1 transglycosylase SLT domain-containing protein [Priestia aryabhattai]
MKIKRNGAYINPLTYLQGKAEGGSFGAAPSGNLAQWIAAGMARAGVSGDAWRTGLNWIIQRESSGNPRAVGAMTSTGRAKGLMQLMDMHTRGNNPFDPVYNIATGIKYIKGRYHTIGSAVDFWKKHHWYANGTNFHPGGNAVMGDNGMNEPYVLPNGVIGISPNTATLYPDLPSGTKVFPSISDFIKDIPSMLPSIPDIGNSIGKAKVNQNSRSVDTIAAQQEQISLLKQSVDILTKILAKSTSFTAEIDGQVLIDFVDDEQAINGRMQSVWGNKG